jgi:anti-sigma factor RsiW
VFSYIDRENRSANQAHGDFVKIDDSILLAYVDEELPPASRAEVEAALASSPELRERLAAMAASALPYVAAFKRQSIPPLPSQLERRVEDLIRVSVDAAGPPISLGTSWRIAAAAFVAGALLCGAMLKYGSHGTSSTGAAAWMQAVAVYQELYARETLINITEDHALTEKIVSESGNAGFPMRIPDLRAAGLAFKRVQRLSYHDQPVIQIVYLPGRGDPVALCIMRERHKSEAPHMQEFGPMQAAVWHDGALGYVLVAKDASVDLLALGRQIARGATQSLYG